MRLIDADSLLIDLNNFVSYETAYEYEEVKECVLSAPTIEAEPVRYGHWIEKEHSKCFHTYCCSKCGHGEIDTTNYCSNCGAKMDEEVEK